MGKRIVIGVGIANYPVHDAGNSWAFLQWALAFRDAGWDVWLVEALTSTNCVDENRRPVTPERSVNVRQARTFLEEFGFADRYALFMDGVCENEPAITRFASSADLFFNISGHFQNEEILRLAEVPRVSRPRPGLYPDLG
jgi:hypothetical protein